MSSKTSDAPGSGSAARVVGEGNVGKHISGDPLGESDALVAIQSSLSDVPGIIPAAKAMSLFGEHAAGWLAISAVGAVASTGGTRQQWIKVGVSAFASHAASVVLKRVVRRKRPHDERIAIGVGTPSKLSFPSSHSTSTTAALVSMANITGNRATYAGIPAIMLSRLVLGVHYPTDVAAGATLGWVTSKAVDAAFARAATRSAGSTSGKTAQK